MEESHTYTIEFYDDRFDLDSELDEECNQCYGKDVADVLSKALNKAGVEVEVWEEDYGWELCGVEQGKSFQIIVYPWGFLEGAEGKDESLWRLRLVMNEVVPHMFIFKKAVSVEFPKYLFEKIRRAVKENFKEYYRDSKGEKW